MRNLLKNELMTRQLLRKAVYYKLNKMNNSFTRKILSSSKLLAKLSCSIWFKTWRRDKSLAELRMLKNNKYIKICSRVLKMERRLIHSRGSIWVVLLVLSRRLIRMNIFSIYSRRRSKERWRSMKLRVSYGISRASLIWRRMGGNQRNRYWIG